LSLARRFRPSRGSEARSSDPYRERSDDHEVERDGQRREREEPREQLRSLLVPVDRLVEDDRPRAGQASDEVEEERRVVSLPQPLVVEEVRVGDDEHGRTRQGELRDEDALGVLEEGLEILRVREELGGLEVERVRTSP